MGNWWSEAVTPDQHHDSDVRWPEVEAGENRIQVTTDVPFIYPRTHLRVEDGTVYILAPTGEPFALDVERFHNWLAARGRDDFLTTLPLKYMLHQLSLGTIDEVSRRTEDIDPRYMPDLVEYSSGEEEAIITNSITGINSVEGMHIRRPTTQYRSHSTTTSAPSKDSYVRIHLLMVYVVEYVRDQLAEKDREIELLKKTIERLELERTK